jgi:hypothetical protein
LQNFVDLLISYALINKLIQKYLSRVYDSDFFVIVEPEPNFSKIPNQFVVLVNVIKKFGVIISIWAFGGISGAIADDMFQAPIIVFVATYISEIDLTWV